MPGAAEIVFALQDHDVVDPEPAELDGRPHPAEARPDDDHLVIDRPCRPRVLLVHRLRLRPR
ncbi:hypothetical protein [Gordonia aichiensis]|uniref:hypothetical protein n=1 Tax=Gordonia aichiensis TaxID=36820 RepID=UPI003263A247